MVGLALAVFFSGFFRVLFDDPFSTVLVDKEGTLVGAQIAKDGQWRFPPPDSIPYKFAVAITQFEDRHFFRHSGVHLPSIIRALYQNLTSGSIVSGGSTLSMQVIRLSRRGKRRTVGEKILEMLLAIQLEFRYSKAEILTLYASHAPFGGNVVGLEAAAWRYFGRHPGALSWSETATLAVLPNAPSLIYPGKNHHLLMAKRNRLISRIAAIGALDPIDSDLAKAEPLPEKPHALPQLAPHLLTRVINERKSGQKISVTLDLELQHQVNQVIDRHYGQLSGNGIHNAAVLVVDVHTGEVKSYIGNARRCKQEHGRDVDIVTAPRSTGSILKPFLYAGMLSDGAVLPKMLVPDIPTYMEGFSPENYSLTYGGAVPAQHALSRSLNIPAVWMLRGYGLEKFHFLLGQLGQRYIQKPAHHYGLTLILGGAESSLWDLCGAYSGMSRSLHTYQNLNGAYLKSDFRSLTYTPYEMPNNETRRKTGILNAGAIYLTWQALQQVNRPESETGWETYASSNRVAWKTGTSFGNRDAWAIGTSSDYVVGVWVGNADGEGRAGMTGVSAAAPVLFDIFDLLPVRAWFDPPYDALIATEICKQSGHRPLDICPERERIYIPLKGLITAPCPYHHLIHLDATSTFRTSSECTSPGQMITQSWFTLPTIQEWYYKSKHPDYRPLPPFDPQCPLAVQERPMGFIYPGANAKIYIPVKLDGSPGEVVFEVTHNHVNETLYWHLDSDFLGRTRSIHQKAVRPGSGKHVMTVIDEKGHRLETAFEVLNAP